MILSVNRKLTILLNRLNGADYLLFPDSCDTKLKIAFFKVNVTETVRDAVHKPDSSLRTLGAFLS